MTCVNFLSHLDMHRRNSSWVKTERNLKFHFFAAYCRYHCWFINRSFQDRMDNYSYINWWDAFTGIDKFCN